VVYVLTYPAVAGVVAACPDDEQGGALATDEMIAAGHERIAFVRMQDYYPGVADRRQKGWASALEAAGVGAEPEWVIDVGEMTAATVRDRQISACVCGNEKIARAVEEQMKDEGVRIPEELSIVSFRYGEATKDSDPFLAAVRLSLSGIVYAGTGMLIDLIEGIEREKVLKFPFVFSPGRSAPPLSDR
jgi:LacI family transcriptional regulator